MRNTRKSLNASLLDSLGLTNDTGAIQVNMDHNLVIDPKIFVYAGLTVIISSAFIQYFKNQSRK